MAKSSTSKTTYSPEFGIFVGLYNKLNNTDYSVAEALQSQTILDTFKITAASLQSTTQTVQNQLKNVTSSTKRLSYESFQKSHGSSVAYKIYTFLKQENSPLSRAEIASKMGIRLCTVCGQVNAMAKAGLVEVVGTKVDETSEREVETLVWR